MMETTTNILALIMFATALFAEGSSRRSYLGRNFVFGIFPSFDKTLSSYVRIYLEIGSKNAGNLVLNVPHLGVSGIKYTLQAKGYTKIGLDYSIQYYGSIKDKRAVSIQTTTDVSVLVTHVLTGNCCGMASYRVYPIDILGTHYISDSYKQYNNYGRLYYYSYLIVIAIVDNTHITIQTKAKIINSTLNAMDIYQHQFHHEENITRSEIVASQQVAVLSGSAFWVHHDFKYGSPMVSQMIPVKYLTDTSIIAEGEPKNVLTIQLLSNSQHVLATITNNTAGQRQNISLKEIPLTGGGPFIITTDFLTQVVQYNGKFMTVVPGISHFMNEYSFVIPTITDDIFSSGSFVNSIVAIVPTRYKDGVVSDGSKLSGMERHISTQNENFTTIQSNITPGFHLVKHTNPGVKFGLLAFGITTDGKWSYGFYVGMSFGEVLSSVPPATSTTVSTTTGTTIPPQGPATTSPPVKTSSTSQATSKPAVTTVGTTTTQKLAATTSSSTLDTGGRLCYSCHDSVRLEYCNVVRNCSANEDCFVKRQLLGGVQVYTTGCVDSNLCERRTPVSPDDSCMECCTANFCNNQGCGDTGTLPRDQRGPLCFDCEHTSSPSLCPTVGLCGKHQLCSIEEFRWGDTLQYRLGCFSESCTRAKRSVSVNDARAGVLKRSAPIRHTCCGTDYCNRNISHLDTGFIGTAGIIG